MAEKLYRVKWYHTEEFEADIGLDDDDMQEIAYRAASAIAESLRIAEAIGRPRTVEPGEEEELIQELIQEKLMEAIVDMDQKALTAAFEGCIEREITKVKELEA